MEFLKRTVVGLVLACFCCNILGKPAPGTLDDENEQNVLREKLQDAAEQHTGLAMIQIFRSCPAIHEKICSGPTTSPSPPSSGATQQSGHQWILDLIQKALDQDTTAAMVDLLRRCPRLRYLVCHAPSPSSRMLPPTSKPTTENQFVDMNFRDEFISFLNRKRRSLEDGLHKLAHKTKETLKGLAKRTFQRKIVKPQPKKDEDDTPAEKRDPHDNGEFSSTVSIPPAPTVPSTGIPNNPISSIVRVDGQFDETLVVDPNSPDYENPWDEKPEPILPVKIRRRRSVEEPNKIRESSDAKRSRKEFLPVPADENIDIDGNNEDAAPAGRSFPGRTRNTAGQSATPGDAPQNDARQPGPPDMRDTAQSVPPAVPRDVPQNAAGKSGTPVVLDVPQDVPRGYEPVDKPQRDASLNVPFGPSHRRDAPMNYPQQSGPKQSRDSPKDASLESGEAAQKLQTAEQGPGDAKKPRKALKLAVKYEEDEEPEKTAEELTTNVQAKELTSHVKVAAKGESLEALTKGTEEVTKTGEEVPKLSKVSVIKKEEMIDPMTRVILDLDEMLTEK